jgi:hypothetical protein
VSGRKCRFGNYVQSHCDVEEIDHLHVARQLVEVVQIVYVVTRTKAR